VSINETLPEVLNLIFGVASVQLSAPVPLLINTDAVPVIAPEPPLVIVPELVAVNVSATPDTAALIVIPPGDPEAISDRLPVAAIALFTVIAVSELAESVRLRLLPINVRPVSTAVSVNVTLPVVEAEIIGVESVDVIVPDPVVSVTAVLPVIVPVPLIEPVPLPAMRTEVPEMPALMVIPLFNVLAVKFNVPVAVIVPVTVIAVPAAESVKLTLDPVEALLPKIACVSVKVTLPVVVNVTLGVAIVNAPEPMAPEPLANFIEVVPDTMPVPDIAPFPVAVMLSTVPETLALTAIPLFAPLAIKVRLPAAEIGLFTVMAVAEEAESVKLKVLPDIVKLVSTAVSVNVTLLAVEAEMVDVDTVDEIVPAVVDSETDVLPVIVPAPLMDPEPNVVNETVVPETAELTTIAPLEASVKLNAPEAVIAPFTVIVAPTVVSVTLNVAPVDAPDIVTEAFSLTNTLPDVLAIKFPPAAKMLPFPAVAPMSPEPAIIVSPVAVIPVLA
jgi:hypothetical protein